MMAALQLGCSAADGHDAAAAADPGVVSSTQRASHEADRDRVEAFLDSIYPRASVRLTVRTDSGVDIDCVDFAEERGVKELVDQGATIDTLLAPFARIAPESTSDGRHCPIGTVPHVRITAERIAASGGLYAFRDRWRNGSGGPALLTPYMNPGSGGLYNGDPGTDYAHVIAYIDTSWGGSQTLVRGGHVTLAIGPTVYLPNEFDHNLGQLWITGGSGPATQTVEAGWVVNGAFGGPSLFVASTQDNYKDYCVNNAAMTLAQGQCVTWIPNPNSPALYPGCSLPASTQGGTQHELTIDVHYECSLCWPPFPCSCYWPIFAAVDGGPSSYLGYYATSGYGTGALSRGSATVFYAGGEVYDSSGNFSTVAMGEGSMLNDFASYGSTAYVRDFGYYADVCSIFECSNSPIASGFYAYSTKSPFYYNTTSPAGSSSWTNWMYYGNIYILIPKLL
jgi:hypothetical protein